MDTNIAQKIARAFVHGLAFAKGMATLAQDAKAKMEEGDKWITIGAEPGDDGKKHGGRHVLISGTGEVKAGLSKSAQGKPLGEAVKELKDKAENKKAKEKKSDRGETAREVGLRMQRAGKEAGERAAAKRTKAEIDRKEAMARAKEYRQETNQIVANDLEPSVAKLKKSLAVRPLPASVHHDLVYMHHLADQIGVMANKLCSLNSKWAENSKESSVFVVNIYGQNAKGTAERVAKLARQSAAIAQDFGKPNNERSYPGLYAHDEIRDNLSELRGLHQDLLDHIRRIQEPKKPSSSESAPAQGAESAPETHTYSAKELDSMKQKQEGRVKAKKQNAELNRKLKEGEKAGNIQFPRNEFRERAKAYTEQANQVINDDLKPSVDKLGSEIRRVTDNARMPQSTLDDLTDIHNLAKQIGPMASKLNKYNEKYAAEHDDPSNYVISNYGAATKGTAETVASLSRRAAAMSNQLTVPDDERDYSEGRAKQEIRDILEEMRGLHGDLLKKTRHAATAFNTSKPSSSESDRVDAMYAQKGSKPKQRIIN